MTPADVATVLTKCAAYDRRTVGRADVAAWHEILEPVELPDALAAVTRHYRATREWAMPADILTHARVAKAERLQRKGRQPQPGQLQLESKYSPRGRAQAAQTYERSTDARTSARERIAAAQRKHAETQHSFATPEHALDALTDALAKIEEGQP